jgi:hypothetical protein
MVFGWLIAIRFAVNAPYPGGKLSGKSRGKMYVFLPPLCTLLPFYLGILPLLGDIYVITV